jgi:GNAT superfamily N-acetyltransferase
MDPQIREYHHSDEEAVVELSLRAWEPVFASMEQVLGHEISLRLHGDWRRFQAKAVRDILANSAMHVWVAKIGRGVVAFVAATLLDPERLLGEISMLAVDPDAQNRGVGTALTEFATAWLRSSGMRVAMVGTGGDVGHAPARHVYEKANYTVIPIARYFQAL